MHLIGNDHVIYVECVYVTVIQEHECKKVFVLLLYRYRK